jgi:hypothetical protein
MEDIIDGSYGEQAKNSSNTCPPKEEDTSSCTCCDLLNKIKKAKFPTTASGSGAGQATQLEKLQKEYDTKCCSIVSSGGELPEFITVDYKSDSVFKLIKDAAGQYYEVCGFDADNYTIEFDIKVNRQVIKDILGPTAPTGKVKLKIKDLHAGENTTQSKDRFGTSVKADAGFRSTECRSEDAKISEFDTKIFKNQKGSGSGYGIGVGVAPDNSSARVNWNIDNRPDIASNMSKSKYWSQKWQTHDSRAKDFCPDDSEKGYKSSCWLYIEESSSKKWSFEIEASLMIQCDPASKTKQHCVSLDIRFPVAWKRFGCEKEACPTPEPPETEAETDPTPSITPEPFSSPYWYIPSGGDLTAQNLDDDDLPAYVMQADSQEAPRIAWASNTQFTLGTKVAGELTTAKDCAMSEHLQKLESWELNGLKADERKELEKDKTALMYQPTDLSFGHMRSKTFARDINELETDDPLSNVPYFDEEGYNIGMGTLDHAFNTFASGQWLTEVGENNVMPKTEAQEVGSRDITETLNEQTDVLIMVPLDEQRKVINMPPDDNGTIDFQLLAKFTKSNNDPEAETQGTAQLNWIGFHDEDGVYDKDLELLSAYTPLDKYEYGLDTVTLGKNTFQFRDSFQDHKPYHSVYENSYIRSTESGSKRQPSRFIVWNFLLEAWSLISLTNKWSKIFVIYSDTEITNWPSIDFQNYRGLTGPLVDVGYSNKIGDFNWHDPSGNEPNHKLRVRKGATETTFEGFAYAVLDKSNQWVNFDNNETHPASIAFWASWAAMNGYTVGWARGEDTDPRGGKILEIIDDMEFGFVNPAVGAERTLLSARASGIQCHLAPLSEPLLKEITGVDLTDEEKPNFYRALGGWLVSESVYRSGTINQKWSDHHSASDVGNPMSEDLHVHAGSIPSDTEYCKLGDDATFKLSGESLKQLALQAIWKPLYYSEETSEGGKERGGRIAYYPKCPIVTNAELENIKKQTDLLK